MFGAASRRDNKIQTLCRVQWWTKKQWYWWVEWMHLSPMKHIKEFVSVFFFSGRTSCRSSQLSLSYITISDQSLHTLAMQSYSCNNIQSEAHVLIKRKVSHRVAKFPRSLLEVPSTSQSLMICMTLHGTDQLLPPFTSWSVFIHPLLHTAIVSWNNDKYPKPLPWHVSSFPTK